MTKWKCESCGNSVEAPSKPEHCPCGSEKIKEVEERGAVERLKSFLPTL